MQAIIKREPQWDPREEYVFRYFQMYLRANASPKPDVSGAWFLGDIEDPAPKNWTKDTPYSPARRTESGTSLLEILIVLAILLTLFGVAVPKFMEALQSVRHLLALIR
jgi:hypothetical protein